MKFFDKIIELEKKTIKVLFKEPKYLKVLSLLIAIVIYLLINGRSPLSIGNLFDKNQYVENIKLEVLSDEGKIVTGLPSSIGVNVSGSETAVNHFVSNADSVVATIDLTGRRDGDYDVKSSEISFSSEYGANIKPIISNFDVTIDTLIQVTKPIEVEYVNGDIASSLILKDPKLDSSSITFGVGMKNKENISSVKVLIDLSKISPSGKETSKVYNEKIKVYDNDGAILQTYTELPTVKVVQDYEINSVALPVNYQVINNNTNKYVSLVCKEANADLQNNICTDEVQVYGKEDVLSKTKGITYNVDLTNFSEDTPYVTVYPLLENGVYIKGNEKYEVKVNLEKGYTKTIKDVPVVVKNLDPNLEVSNIGNVKIDITVTGAKGLIENMKASDITLYLDAEEISTANKYELPLQVDINSNIDYELSTNNINVELKEK